MQCREAHLVPSHGHEIDILRWVHAIFPQDLPGNDGQGAFRRHNGDVLPAQLGHRLDVGLGDEIPSGLVLKNRDDFDGNTPDRRRQSAAGVGEEIDFSGKSRSDRDLAADTEKLRIEPFFFQVTFFLGDDEAKHRSVHRRIGDPDIFKSGSRLNGEERNDQGDENQAR